MARTIEIDNAILEQLCEHARQLGCNAEVSGGAVHACGQPRASARISRCSLAPAPLAKLYPPTV